MIIFENTGELDFRALSQFGINVKESDSPIGFFGTGLKYALAVLMREGAALVIHSGLRTCVVSKQSDTFRGKDFEFISTTIDGVTQMLGFTTELGKNWEMWAAYREIACNCMDEGGEVYESAEFPSPQAGTTLICVSHPDFETAYAERGRYILQDEPDMRGGHLELRNGVGNSVYFRGIKVHSAQRNFMYRYNLLEGVTLTEDRTANGNPSYLIAKGLLQLSDVATLKRILSAKSEWAEYQFDYHGWGTPPSPAFLQAVAELILDRLTDINPSALRLWKEVTKSSHQMDALTLTPIQAAKLARAIAFVERHGYEVSQYPIVIVEALGEGVLALADTDNDRIYLTTQLFQIGGAAKLASCLIEEYLHLKHGFDDCSRALQTYLFEKLVSTLEELQGSEV